MMFSSFLYRKSLLRSSLLVMVGMVFLGGASKLLFMHTQTIMEVKDVSIPLVAELPRLERRLTVLKEQVELSELSSATRLGSQEERVRVFALPEKADLDRLLAFFEVLREILERNGQLAEMSSVEVGDSKVLADGANARPVSVGFVVHEDGLETVMLLMHLAGLLTVGDILSEEEITLIVDRVEQENPVAVTTLEQFFSVDILKYAQNSKLYEEQLKRSISSTSVINAFQNVLRASLLRDTKRYLGSDLGSVLERYKLWPLQFMRTEHVEVEQGGAEGWYRLNIGLQIYSRSQD